MSTRILARPVAIKNEVSRQPEPSLARLAETREF